MATPSASSAWAAYSGAGFVASLYEEDRSRAASQRDREWQERMSNSAYQRSMADMRKAGLNPILAYQKGGASTPGGSTSKVPDYGSAVSTALKAKMMGAQLALLSEQVLKTKAETSLTSATELKMFEQEKQTRAATEKSLTENEMKKLLLKQASATGNSVTGRNLWSMYRAGKISWEAVRDKVKSWYKKGSLESARSRKKNQARKANVGKGNRYKYGKPKRGKRWQYNK